MKHRTPPAVKVLIKLFQKFAGQGQSPCRRPQTAKHPRHFSFVRFSFLRQWCQKEKRLRTFLFLSSSKKFRLQKDSDKKNKTPPDPKDQDARCAVPPDFTSGAYPEYALFPITVGTVANYQEAHGFPSPAPLASDFDLLSPRARTNRPFSESSEKSTPLVHRV